MFLYFVFIVIIVKQIHDLEHLFDWFLLISIAYTLFHSCYIHIHGRLRKCTWCFPITKEYSIFVFKTSKGNWKSEQTYTIAYLYPTLMLQLSVGHCSFNCLLLFGDVISPGILITCSYFRISFVHSIKIRSNGGQLCFDE